MYRIEKSTCTTDTSDLIIRDWKKYGINTDCEMNYETVSRFDNLADAENALKEYKSTAYCYYDGKQIKADIEIYELNSYDEDEWMEQIDVAESKIYGNGTAEYDCQITSEFVKVTMTIDEYDEQETIEFIISVEDEMFKNITVDYDTACDICLDAASKKIDETFPYLHGHDADYYWNRIRNFIEDVLCDITE